MLPQRQGLVYCIHSCRNCSGFPHKCQLYSQLQPKRESLQNFHSATTPYSCFLSWVEVKSSRKREIAAAHMALPTPYEPMKSVTTTQHNDRYGHTTRSIIPAGEAFFKDKIEGRIGYLCYALISGVWFYARHRFFAFPAGTRGRGTPARRDACRKPKGRPFAMGKAVPQGRKRP